jgi:hypothetical protein
MLYPARNPDIAVQGRERSVMRFWSVLLLAITCFASPLLGEDKCPSRESEGLKGKVSEVVTHTRQFDALGQLLDSDDEVVRYDVAGRRTETILYRENGAKSYEGECVYSPNGKLASFSGSADDGQKIQQAFDGEGRLLSTKVMIAGHTREIERYVRDSKGRVIERRDEGGVVEKTSYRGKSITTTVEPGGLMRKEQFDRRGRAVQKLECHDAGEDCSRYVTKYDASGNLVSALLYAIDTSDGSELLISRIENEGSTRTETIYSGEDVSSKNVTTSNDHGLQTHSIDYQMLFPRMKKTGETWTEYEFDAAGNWTGQIHYRWDAAADKRLKGEEVTREILYY